MRMIAHPPPRRHDGKGVQLTAFGDLNLSALELFNGLGKWLADISTIGQETLNGL